MEEWKNIKIEGIAKIEKYVAEFDVWELNKTPWGKFKVKIVESSNGKYTGYTNLQLKSISDASSEGGVGFGNTIEEALEDTIRYFLCMLNEREVLNKDDFECVDPYDF
jgi:hypothetical protein